MMDAFEFLQHIQAHTENNLDIKECVLGYIDYDFDPSKYPQELPRIIIDGQGLSNQGYRCLSSYDPIPGDRVILLPKGTSYVVLGSFDRTDSILLQPGQLVFQAFQTTSQSVPNYGGNAANIVGINWTESPLDLLGAWSSSSNPSRFIPTVAGWYEFNGAISLESTSDPGYRNAVWKLNGSVANSSGSRFLGNTTGSGYSTQLAARTRSFYLNGTTDYVELAVYHSTGAARNTNVSSAEYQPHMEVKYVGGARGAYLRSLE